MDQLHRKVSFPLKQPAPWYVDSANPTLLNWMGAPKQTFHGVISWRHILKVKVVMNESKGRKGDGQWRKKEKEERKEGGVGCPGFGSHPWQQVECSSHSKGKPSPYQMGSNKLFKYLQMWFMELSKSFSVVSDSATQWTIQSMEFSRPEDWNG